MRRVQLFAVLAIGSAALPAPSTCQLPPTSVPARGVDTTPSFRRRLLGVFDRGTGEPIEGVRVVDVISRVTAITTRTGTVSLVFLPEGASVLRFEKIGYQPQLHAIEISPADTVPLTILLEPVVNTLPTVVTTDSSPRYLAPGLAGFEERRHQGFGHFASEAELRKHDNQTVTSVVRQFPGLFISCSNRTPRVCVAQASRLGSSHVLGGGS